jgi:hypothetical protein
MKFDLGGWENISFICAYQLRITPRIIMIVEKHLYTFGKKGFGCFRGGWTPNKFSHVNKTYTCLLQANFKELVRFLMFLNAF